MSRASRDAPADLADYLQANTVQRVARTDGDGQTKHIVPILRAPCGNCPFRIDEKRVKLRRARAEQIVESLRTGESFPCHKTVRKPGVEVQHCAGAALLLHAEREPNMIMQLAQRLEGYDAEKVLDQAAPVAKTFQQFVELHGQEP